jgi:hypothetical protein
MIFKLAGVNADFQPSFYQENLKISQVLAGDLAELRAA